MWAMTLFGNEKIHSFLAGFGPAKAAGLPLRVATRPRECTVRPAWRHIRTSIDTAAQPARAAHTSAGIACRDKFARLMHPREASFDIISSRISLTAQLLLCDSVQHDYHFCPDEHKYTHLENNLAGG